MKKNNIGSNSTTRRQFIKTGLIAATALTVVPRHVLGRGFIPPSDQITLGFIGTGKQSRYLVTEFARRARVIAGCDVYAAKLEQFKSITEDLYAKAGSSAKGFKTYKDFRELLANDEIDAVVIGTPDHWHAINVIEAAKAGKDVYCEKPYSHSITEGRLMVQAIEKYKRINQTGNMQRSWKNFRNACQLVRNGYIGDIREIKVCVGPPPKKYDLPNETLPPNVDWDLWIGPAEYHEFNAELAPPLERDIYPNWRNYKEYGNGMTADWGAHMFDIAQWAIGKDNSGPIAVYPPDKDHKYLTLVYDNGITMTHEDFNRGNAVRFIGSKGVIDISREFFETMPGKLANHEFSDKDIKLYESNDHYQNWLDCIRSRRQPISTAEIGHRTATVCFLANIGYELKRPLSWNPVKEEFICDDEANKLRAGSERGVWRLKI
ncbi:MAG: Gfo/Idh/MocA family oxidoreductase [Prevotellaceae bacterium]|jgi:predicted dehydrogenase|nr:Gfo/Idh/MocA family oxidoreductase [Prevotellaceae bacterium]